MEREHTERELSVKGLMYISRILPVIPVVARATSELGRSSLYIHKLMTDSLVLYIRALDMVFLDLPDLPNPILTLFTFSILYPVISLTN